MFLVGKNANVVKIYGSLQKNISYVRAEYGWPIQKFEWKFLLNNGGIKTKLKNTIRTASSRTPLNKINDRTSMETNLPTNLSNHYHNNSKISSIPERFFAFGV